MCKGRELWLPGKAMLNEFYKAEEVKCSWMSRSHVQYHHHVFREWVYTAFPEWVPDTTNTSCGIQGKALRNSVDISIKSGEEGDIIAAEQTAFNLVSVIYYLYEVEQIQASLSLPVTWEWQYNLWWGIEKNKWDDECGKHFRITIANFTEILVSARNSFKHLI